MRLSTQEAVRSFDASAVNTANLTSVTLYAMYSACLEKRSNGAWSLRTHIQKSLLMIRLGVARRSLGCDFRSATPCICRQSAAHSGYVRGGPGDLAETVLSRAATLRT
jgi:hypothetical protein